MVVKERERFIKVVKVWSEKEEKREEKMEKS
jgi:hypothetical protein